MAESLVSKTLRDGTIKIKDASGLVYEVTIEQGNFTVTPNKAGRTVIFDRHVIAGLRKAQDPIGSLSFTVSMRQFTHATDATIIDVMDRSGAWAAAVSVGGAAYEQFLVNVEAIVAGLIHGDSGDHQLTFAKVFLDWSFSEGDPNTINVTGEVYGGYTKA